MLISHPQMADAAVFGVPNEDLGEEVKAVFEPIAGVTGNADFARLLIGYCQELPPMKCPRSIDFTDALPPLPTGKLYKKLLRDSYWTGRGSSRLV